MVPFFSDSMTLQQFLRGDCTKESKRNNIKHFAFKLITHLFQFVILDWSLIMFLSGRNLIMGLFSYEIT
jgi:hypothetical protein